MVQLKRIKNYFNLIQRQEKCWRLEIEKVKQNLEQL